MENFFSRNLFLKKKNKCGNTNINIYAALFIIAKSCKQSKNPGMRNLFNPLVEMYRCQKVLNRNTVIAIAEEKKRVQSNLYCVITSYFFTYIFNLSAFYIRISIINRQIFLSSQKCRRGGNTSKCSL